MLVSFEPARLCTAFGDVILAPLPGRRQLWEAPDHVSWKRDRDLDAGEQMEFGLAKNGQLVKFSQEEAASMAITCGGDLAASPTVIEWSEWCSDMDGIGSLVMLSASMVKPV